MAGINSYEELLSVVEGRQQDRLVLEVDLGTTYSQEYEDAKKELQQAKTLKTVTGEQQFLSDNIDQLRAKVEELKPDSLSVWLAYKRLDLKTWSLLAKKSTNMTPFDQYEKVLEDTFLGIYNDPEAEPEHLLTDDYHTVSSESTKCLLSGSLVNSVVQSFMTWQNSGGNVTIHPTK